MDPKPVNPSLPWQDLARDGMFDDTPREEVFKLLGSKQNVSVLDVLLNSELDHCDRLWLIENQFRYGRCSCCSDHYRIRRDASRAGAKTSVNEMRQLILKAQKRDAPKD